MTALSVLEAPPECATVYATELFGPLEVDDAHLMHFDDGLLGFQSFRRWILLEGARKGTSWLQSADHSALAFLLIEPFVVFDEFTIDIPAGDVVRLGAAHADDLVVFSLVTLPNNDGVATANLQGPLLMNLTARRGAQIVISESAWSLRQPLPADLLRPER